jgi:hypothetical protein
VDKSDVLRLALVREVDVFVDDIYRQEHVDHEPELGGEIKEAECGRRNRWMVAHAELQRRWAGSLFEWRLWLQAEFVCLEMRRGWVNKENMSRACVLGGNTHSGGVLAGAWTRDDPKRGYC